MSKKLRFAMRRAMSGVLHTSQCVSDVMSLLLIPTPCTPAYSPALSVQPIHVSVWHVFRRSAPGRNKPERKLLFSKPADINLRRNSGCPASEVERGRDGGASGRAPRPTAPPGAARGGRGVEPRGETGAEKGAAFRVLALKSGGARPRARARGPRGTDEQRQACRSRPL